MYNQYNSYQQSGVGTAVATTQPGLTWNGTSWVPTAPTSVGPNVSTTATHSSYASAVTGGGSTSNNNNASAAQLTSTYTQYYHGWKAREQEQERLAQTLPVGGSSHQEALRQAQWAKYYANLASAAAHHYHNHPNGRNAKTGASVPPPTLPPAPPPVAASASASPAQQQVPAATFMYSQQSQHQQYQSSSHHVAPGISSQQQQSLPQAPPEGLKRYVHKCLQQCQAGGGREAMQKEVERVIAEAIRDGTMQTTDWDRKELLLPGAARPGALVGTSNNSNSCMTPQQPQMDTATAVQKSGGTAAAIKKFRNQQDNNNLLINSSSNSAQSQTGTTAVFATSPFVGHHYGPTRTVSTGGNGYYGPGNNDNDDGSLFKQGESTYKSKWTLQDKFPPSASRGQPQDFTSSDNYYGAGSSKDLDEEEDFISLASNKIARKRKRGNNNKAAALGKVKVKKEVILRDEKGGGLDKSSLALQKRANRFGGAGGILEAASLPTTTNRNMDRFMGLALIGGSKKLDDADYEQMKVKGTCHTLEKEYLRLTAPPRAEVVRPQPILSKHMENLKAEWKSPTRRDYIWFCSQLKAVRQDLTVQQIVNAFAVNVYETHARIALEEGDLNEYNQCQTQLKELYKALHADPEATKNQNEFIAYRLIYYVFLQGNKKYEGGSSDLFNIMLSLTPEQRRDQFISHALNVRVAVAEYDYHAFFRLLKHCSKHATYLMNYMVPKVRHWSLQRICKAYRPSVSTKHVLEELGFDADKELKFGKKWLASCGVVLSESGHDVLAKDSVVRESDLAEKASSLI